MSRVAHLITRENAGHEAVRARAHLGALLGTDVPRDHKIAALRAWKRWQRAATCGWARAAECMREAHEDAEIALRLREAGPTGVNWRDAVALHVVEALVAMLESWELPDATKRRPRRAPEAKRGPSQLALLAGLCALLGLGLGAGPASARTESDALLLARVVVSESGWDGWASGDGYAIHYAQLTVADRDGTSWRSAARSLSPRATGLRPTVDPRLSWVSGLREDLLAPARWPGSPHAPWVAYRARWLAVLERAREVVTWDLDLHDEWSPCEERPITWAARWHTPSPGLRALDCGDTANLFYTGAR